jgi:threonylcarbamoyladenosine tRNA methylthiotransferase MtaB
MTTFYIEQFGCRATQADGAAIERQLRDRGFTVSPDSANADVIVVNTCTVTAAADSQARDAIRKFHAANSASRIIVTGCYAQRAPEELATLPGVSFVVGNSHKPQIPELVTAISTRNSDRAVLGEGTASAVPQGSAALGVLTREFGNGHSQSIDEIARTSLHSISLQPQQIAETKILIGDIFQVRDVLVAPVLGGEGNHTRPTLKIQDGCDSRCSFCVIPFVRGKSRSLPPQAVITEIQKLVDSGFREIVLSGINLGTYGRDLSPRCEFEDLLRRILDETSVEHLRISSIEPLDVTRDLINLFASTDRIAPHFHMPLQSASDRVLAAMRRWYRAEHYSRRVELIQEYLPHAAIGADVIAGFPGETEQDHEASLHFIQDRPFFYLHVFSYSSRPGTKAASLPHAVSAENIKRRARELRALSEAKSTTFRRAHSGRTLRALTLRREPDRDGAATPALTSNYISLRLPAILAANQFVLVEMHSSGEFTLLDVPVSAAGAIST